MFARCHSYNVHLTWPKHYRHYGDEKGTVICQCKHSDGELIRKTIEADFWGDEEIPYKVGEPCERCGSKFKYPKFWILRCSICKPKEVK